LYAALLAVGGALLLFLLREAPDTGFNGFIFAAYVLYALFTTGNRALTRVTIQHGRILYESWFGLQRRAMTLSTVATVQGRVLPAITAGGANMILRRADGLGIRMNLALFNRATLARLLEAILAHSPDAKLDRFWENALRRARR
jgi:hypothetical protein